VLTIDPTTTPATLYLATNYSGIYRSLDGGLSWSAVNSGLPSDSNNYVGWVESLFVDPTAIPVTLYTKIFTKGRYKGTPDGSGSIRWVEYSPVTLPSEAIITGINTKTTPGTLYASDNGLYRSTDGGANWQKMTDLSLLGPLAIDGTSTGQDTLYSPTYSGIYKSTDSGAHWAFSNSGVRATTVSAFAIDQANPAVFYAGLFYSGRFMKSEDSGHSWAEIGLNAPWPRALLVDPTTTPSTVYVGNSTGIFKSTDGGLTWQSFSDGLTASSYKDIRRLYCDSRTNTIYAGGRGLYRLNKNDAGGGTWQQLFDYNVITFAIDALNPYTIYVGSDGVYKSIDGGATWAVLWPDWPIIDYYEFEEFADAVELVIDPFNSNVVYASDGNVFHQWDNNAQRWVSPALNLSSVGTLSKIHFDPTTPGTMYIVTDLGVYWSNDSGSTWQNLSVTEKVRGGRAQLTVDPINPQMLYATMDYLGSGVLRFIQGQ
jgi:photosystem II stability/assembly factor-like uncharacterized protein